MGEGTGGGLSNVVLLRAHLLMDGSLSPSLPR